MPWNTLFGFLAPWQNVEKTNDPNTIKHPEKGKNEQTLFCRTRQATAAGPINIVNERLAEERVLLLRNPYVTNENCTLHPSLDKPNYNYCNTK